MSAVAPSWMGLDRAAAIIGAEVVTLRRAVERNSRRTPSGTIEAAFDGVRARKFGRKWKVTLDASWLNPFGR